MMQDLMLKRIFILTGIACFLWLIYLLLPVVIPFVMAFFIAYLFSPLAGNFSGICFYHHCHCIGGVVSRSDDLGSAGVCT